MNKRLESFFIFTISILLFYTAFEKIVNFHNSAYSIAYSGLFPKQWTHFILVLVLGSEIGIAILLLVNPYKGLRLLLGLFFIFTGYLVYLFIQGKYVICGCGGILNSLSFGWHLLLNATILLLSIYFYTTYET